MSSLLPCALLLDAQHEVVRAIEHLPAPARGGPIGRLNDPGWITAHVASTLDAWINAFVQELDHDRWLAGWFDRHQARPESMLRDTPLDEATDALHRAGERAAAYLESADVTLLRRKVERLRGTPWEGMTAAYLVARAAAHLFVHAGELSVIGSLAGAGDLGLPGKLARVAGAEHDVPDEAGHALTAALLLDARSEFDRVARALPRPGYGPTLERLNAGGFIVAHVAEQEDRTWNGGEAADAWLRDANVAHGAPPSAPDFAAALASWERVTATSERRVATLAVDALRSPGAAGSGARPAQSLARSAAHCLAHAGELEAIGSLVGGSSLDLPGALAFTARAARS